MHLRGQLPVGVASAGLLLGGERTHGAKRLWHPALGELTLSFENFTIPDADGERLVTFHAPPGSPAADKLTLLGIRDQVHALRPPDPGPLAR